MAEQPGIAKYPNVFSPIRLGPVEIPNRIYMAPHGIPLQADSAGMDSAEPAIERMYYFAERAAGGTGLIIHSTQIVNGPPQDNLSESIAHPEHVASYRRISEAVHGHGAKIMAEIWYVNWLPKRWERLGPLAPLMGPSATQNIHMATVRHAMSKHAIDLMLDAYRASARHVRDAGYDGIQMHISHGSLVEYFLTPYHNKRTDEYGGSFENRVRFMMETLAVCREEISDEMALGIRINADEMLPGGLDEGDVREILEYLVKAGVIDFVDLDISVEPEQVQLMTTGMFDPVMHNAERVARVGVGAAPLPVLATPGRVTSIADCERLIVEGVTDMVGIVRGLIAEPELVNNARDGREAERRICVAVNHCVSSQETGWGCAINPAAGKEERYSDRLRVAAPSAKRVVIVGGGPAGLEAARVAALRGHEVTVLERSAQLGGGVALWAELPGRSAMRSLVNYLSRRMSDLGVDVRTGVEATADTVLALEPDVAIVATGSRYSRTGSSGFVLPPMPGWDQDFVVAPESVITGETKLGGTVVVLDDEGLHAATGVAEIAAASASSVQLVTRHPIVAARLDIAIGYIATRLRSASVDVLTSTYMKSIGDHAVTLFEVMTGEERTVDGVDHVVLATMREPVDELRATLDGKVPYVYLIGDALAPRLLREATYEGHRFAQVIGEPDMPASVEDELFRPDRHVLRPASSAAPGAALEGAVTTVA